MSSNDLIKEIYRYTDHKVLYDLWQHACDNLPTGNPLLVTSKQVNFWQKGKALEYIILRAFELEGADVIYPYEVEINHQVVEQIDGAIFVDGMSVLIECKDYTSIVIDTTPIAKLRSQLLRRHSNTIGAFFSMTRYSAPAMYLSSNFGQQLILLWTKADIEYCLIHRSFRKAMLKKYRHAITSGHNLLDITLNNI